MKHATLLLSLILLLGCSRTRQAQQPAPAAKPPTLRCCVMQDLSGSIAETRTPRITEAELRQLAELVMARGGELAFGVIQDRSDRPLVRLTVGEPPPPAPPEPHNPLYRRRWEQQRAEAEGARRAWEAEQQKRAAAFLQQVQARLEAPLAPYTDVCGAIRRCDLMLAEPSRQSATGFLLLSSDGQHNVRRSECPPSLAAQARVLLVNGAGLEGIVERYRPARFESIGAAIKFIKESSTGGE